MQNKTKICSRCKIEKLMEEFHNNKKNKDGKSSWCKECYKEYHILTHPNIKEKMIIKEGFKYCPTCKRQLPINHFGKCKNRYDGLQWRCNDCRKKYRDENIKGKGVCIYCGNPVSKGKTKCITCTLKLFQLDPEWKKNQIEGNRKNKSSLEYRKTISGSNSHLWEDGRTALSESIHKLPEMKQWREAVFKRDNYRDIFGRTGDIVAHHIKPFNIILKENNIKTKEDAIKCKELWDVDNGITMLKESHIKHHQKYGYMDYTEYLIFKSLKGIFPNLSPYPCDALNLHTDTSFISTNVSG
jgi:hypothetical protein